MKTLEQTLQATVDHFDVGTVVLYTPPTRFGNGGYGNNNIYSGLRIEPLGPSFFGVGPANPMLNLGESTIPEVDFEAIQRALALPPLIKPEETGLLNREDFTYGIAFPATGTELHFHGPDQTTITYGKLIQTGSREKLAELNGMEAALAELRALAAGFKPFK